jgi:hypothetical protein
MLYASRIAAHAAVYSRSWSRHCDGVSPVIARNRVLRCCSEAQPTSCATSVIDDASSSNRFFAWRTRASASSARNELPASWRSRCKLRLERASARARGRRYRESRPEGGRRASPVVETAPNPVSVAPRTTARGVPRASWHRASPLPREARGRLAPDMEPEPPRRNRQRSCRADPADEPRPCARPWQPPRRRSARHAG